MSMRFVCRYHLEEARAFAGRLADGLLTSAVA
jgi:hypothetical protein